METDSAPASLPTQGSYSHDEVSQRIRLYMFTGAVSSLLAQLVDLASMQDGQLQGMSVIRWTIKILILVLSAALAAGNAKRAAIDRSTAGGGVAPPPDRPPDQPGIPGPK